MVSSCSCAGLRIRAVIDRVEQRHAGIPNPAFESLLRLRRSPPRAAPDPLHEIPVAFEGLQSRRGNIESSGDAGPILRINADEKIGPLQGARSARRCNLRAPSVIVLSAEGLCY